VLLKLDIRYFFEEIQEMYAIGALPMLSSVSVINEIVRDGPGIALWNECSPENVSNSLASSKLCCGASSDESPPGKGLSMH